ncbi:MAG: STAS domain-containing protein [Candidatus Cloacimonetes bacterium]|jgi:anti-sigma B factor antagonist|nr:STAS domain-containing protein [Candidatus Cloacimonadota bacterium]MDD4157596.1 STAS domain-containing protein [Candidatus Cloacimonadota bacterium]
MLEISSVLKDNQVVISLKGRLDTVSSKQLEIELEKFIDGPEVVIISFEDLDYISSAGLRVILTYYKKFNSLSKQYILTKMNSLVKEVFDISGFSKFLQIT